MFRRISLEEIVIWPAYFSFGSGPSRPGFFNVLCEEFEGVDVPSPTQACDLTDSVRRDHRVPAELLTSMNVRYMDLDHRQPGVEQRIQNRVADLGKRSTIDYDTVGVRRDGLDMGPRCRPRGLTGRTRSPHRSRCRVSQSMR